jgi:hypothetical protein
MLISNGLNSQVLEINFNGYSKFKCTDLDVNSENILTSSALSYYSIGFGKNHVIIDFNSKKITNEYYVNNTYKGTLNYYNLSDYFEKDGIISFNATRIHPDSKLPYKEYFVIYKNAINAEKNIPYLLTYWFENDIIQGNIVNRDLLY